MSKKKKKKAQDTKSVTLLLEISEIFHYLDFNNMEQTFFFSFIILLLRRFTNKLKEALNDR